jgi:hypothetical protein
VAYAFLADGRDNQQMMELDLALAPSEESRQETIDKANMEAMKALQSQLGGLSPPPRRR